MFKKLISSLPFNPSLIGQVSFYAKRLRRENSIRRMGFILMILVLAVQIFAIFSPAQSSLAQSRNDIIPGGFKSKEQAVNHCNRNDHKFATILANFNISCNDLQKSDVKSIRSTDYNRQLFSMGRLPYDKPHEVSVRIKDAGLFYMRPLWSWDSGAYSTYTALVGKSDSGDTFMVLFNCGNLVLIGVPKPEPEPCPQDPKIDANDPKCKVCPYNKKILKSDKECTPCEESANRNDKLACLVLTKSAVNKTTGVADANNTTAKPGDIIEYTLSVKNTGKANVNDFVIEENMSDVLDYADVVDLFGGKINNDNVVSWPAVDIKPKQTVQKFMSVKIKDPLPQTPAPSSNLGTFDLVMTNVYGNAVNIMLPGSIVKTTEQISGSLPNTGPGEVLVIAFSLSAVVGYFFARSRLLSRELDIITSEFSLTGGL